MRDYDMYVCSFDVRGCEIMFAFYCGRFVEKTRDKLNDKTIIEDFETNVIAKKLRKALRW